MRFIWKWLLVALLIFSVIFVLKLLVDGWIRSLPTSSSPYGGYGMFLMVGVEPKILRCLFLSDVLCSYVKSEKSTGVMSRCLKCPHYFRFLRIMAEEDEKVMDEIDRMREYDPNDG